MAKVKLPPSRAKAAATPAAPKNGATEKYAKQLHEMSREEYLAVKQGGGSAPKEKAAG